MNTFEYLLVVVPEIVPGRMVLLVTTLLSLITMFDTVRNNSPDALELKCIEVYNHISLFNQSILYHVSIPGLVAMLHILCVSSIDGVFHCTIWYSL